MVSGLLVEEPLLQSYTKVPRLLVVFYSFVVMMNCHKKRFNYLTSLGQGCVKISKTVRRFDFAWYQCIWVNSCFVRCKSYFPDSPRDVVRFD